MVQVDRAGVEQDRRVLREGADVVDQGGAPAVGGEHQLVPAGAMGDRPGGCRGAVWHRPDGLLVDLLGGTSARTSWSGPKELPTKPSLPALPLLYGLVVPALLRRHEPSIMRRCPCPGAAARGPAGPPPVKWGTTCGASRAARDGDRAAEEM
ncbi:hypothetical protein [Kitasatospora sp. NPDC093102]|uniref:hypothetical protein n=1 Tax=Kitasatospora sp. NPDC093102 TaxID=3155069 RepID=UPI00342C2835